MAGCHSRSCQYQCTTVPRRSRRMRRGGGVVATVPSLCNADVLCTGARRSEACCSGCMKRRRRSALELRRRVCRYELKAASTVLLLAVARRLILRVATLPSIFNAEVLCTGAALTQDAARRAAAAAAGSGGVDLCACVASIFCFLGPFLAASFSAPFSAPFSEKNKSALPDLTDINVQDAGGGEAGSSSTEAPRTPAKPAEAQDQTRHRRAIIENRRTASWMARRVSSGR